MKIRIDSLSKIKHGYIRSGIEEYIKRLRRVFHIELNELNDESPVLKTLPDSMSVIIDKSGKELSSEDFSAWLFSKVNSGTGQLNLIIGPDTGFRKEFLNNDYEKISLSTLTFSGELSCLVLTEQIYRAYSIYQKTSYHK